MEIGNRVQLVEKDEGIRAESVKVGDRGTVVEVFAGTPTVTYARVKYDSAPHLAIPTDTRFLEEVR